MKKLLLALALLFPGEAWAQCNGIFGTNQVCGSIAGGPPGPVDASIFSTLGITVATPVIPNYILTGNSPSSAVWLPNITDTSSILGNAASVYNPTYYGTSGTGIVDRMNRVFIGSATHSSSDVIVGTCSGSPCAIPTVPDWADSYFGGGAAVSGQLAVGSAVGWSAIVGYSRSSDWRAAFGSDAQATIGLAAYVVNDDAVAAPGGPLALSLLAVAARTVVTTGVTLAAQFDVNSKAAVVDVSPFSGPSAGTTIGLLLTSGAYASLATNNISTALLIGPGLNGPVFRKGIVCQHGAVDPTVGDAGDGTCIEVGRNQSMRWVNSGDGIDGEISADANGIKFPVDQPWQAFTASPSCGTAAITTNSARRKTLGKTTFAEVDFTITSIGTCAGVNVITFNLPITAASAAGLVGEEFQNSAKGVHCFTLAGLTTMVCRKDDFSVLAVTDHMVASGVIENQ